MQSSEEKKLRSDIDELKEELRLEKTTNPANQTAMQIILAKQQQLAAMQQQLAAIRQKEVLLMQGEQA